MLDIMIFYNNSGEVEKIIKINENRTFEEVEHRPWFIAVDIIPHKLVLNARQVPISFYAFNEATLRYEKVSDSSYIIYCRKPSDVRRLAEIYEDNNVKHAMSNIRYKARVSLDLSDHLFGIKIPAILHYSLNEIESIFEDFLDKLDKIKILAFDIEVKAQGRFPRRGEEVFLVSLAEGNLMDDSEEAMVLEKEEVFDLKNIIDKCNTHYIVGFVSTSFDIPYLISYINDLPLSREGYVSDTNCIPHIDIARIMDQHGSAFGLPLGVRLALDDIAERMGLIKNEAEIELENSIDRNRIWLEYQNDRNKVVKYAEVDAKLTLRIGKEVLKTLLSLYLLTGISPSTVQILPSFGSISEYSVLDVIRRKYRKVYEVRNVKWTSRELDNGIAFYRKGTKEHFIESGVWNNVLYVDFSMLYPTIYYKYNLDPEGAIIGNGFKVYLVPKSEKEREREVYVSFRGGHIHEILSYFYKARKISKKLKDKFSALDQAVKILVNSAYGMFSKGRGGAINEVVSGFIFYKSSQIFQNTLGIIKNVIGRDYVYGATDSIFILLKDNDDPNAIVEKLNKVIQRRFGKEFVIKMEGIAKHFALLRRKTYVCVMEDGEVIVKGLERHDFPACIKDNMDIIFKRVLEGESWAKVLNEIIKSAPMRDLFVRVTKSISDLYDEDEKRFKEINHNRTKAIIVKYLIDEGQRIGHEGTLVLHLTRQTLQDIPVQAYFLSSDNAVMGRKCIYVLDEFDSDTCSCYEVGLLDRKISNDEIMCTFACRRVTLKREQVERLAVKQSEILVNMLKEIENMRKQRRLM